MPPYPPYWSPTTWPLSALPRAPSRARNHRWGAGHEREPGTERAEVRDPSKGFDGEKDPLEGPAGGGDGVGRCPGGWRDRRHRDRRHGPDDHFGPLRTAPGL